MFPLSPQLDASIDPDQLTHETDHETIAAALNAVQEIAEKSYADAATALADEAAFTGTFVSWGAWQNMGSFVNSWAVGFVTPQYRKSIDGSLLQFKGLVTGGASGAIVTTLPVGYRPATSQWVSVGNVSAGSGVCLMLVESNGQVTIYQGDPADYRSIDSVLALN